MQSNDELLARLHETYQSPLPEGAPVRTPSSDLGRTFMFRDAQPGTVEWARAHLAGSSAPEPVMERWDGIGPEDFGPVEFRSGRTGEHIGRINRHARKRIMQSGLEP